MKLPVIIFLLATLCLQVAETKKLLNTRKRRLHGQSQILWRRLSKEANKLLPTIKRRLEDDTKPTPVKTMTLTPTYKDGKMKADDNDINYWTTGPWGVGASGLPIAKSVLKSTFNFTWHQDQTHVAKVCYTAFAPWEKELLNAKLTVNSKFSRQTEVHPENKGVKEMCEWLSPFNCLGATNTAVIGYVSSPGQYVMYIKNVRVEVYDVSDLKNLSQIYNQLSDSAYSAAENFDKALNGVVGIITSIKKKMHDQQLAIKIGGTAGNVIMGTAIVAGFFTAGMSLVVAGAVGATMGLAATGANLATTEITSHEIGRAMQDLNEFQWNFAAKTDTFSKFVSYTSEKTHKDIPHVQACLNLIKKSGMYGYKLYKLKKSFDNIKTMFQWIEDGKESVWAIKSVKYSADLESAVMRVGVNLGKEVSTMQKTSLQIGETTFGVCKILERVNILLLTADTIQTWTHESPAESKCTEQIDQIKAQQKILKDFYTPLNPVKSGLDVKPKK